MMGKEQLHCSSMLPSMAPFQERLVFLDSTWSLCPVLSIERGCLLSSGSYGEYYVEIYT
jgi:hypothetical protein